MKISPLGVALLHADRPL